jgi:phosphoribosylformylglycinamidine synthase subunit PurQ / glutaminase
VKRVYSNFLTYAFCMPTALVIRAPGTNCDQEMLRGFVLAGAAAELVHLDALIASPDLMDSFDLLGFPGGFSYGDDIASGRIFAMKLRERLYPSLKRAIERGTPIIGACNGFQTLVQVGLLPGPSGGVWPQTPMEQTVALSDNTSGRFTDRWVGVTYESNSACVWTKNLASAFADSRGDVQQLPVAHGEGRFVVKHAETLAALEASDQIVLRYNDNFNGSTNAIAGICDSTGLVFGLMPHPERYLSWQNHPYWTRLGVDVKKGPTPGLMMFQNAVAATRKLVGAARGRGM